MKELSPSELIVMKAIWNNGELSSKNAFLEANKISDKQWQFQTVSTFLNRLTSKGFVEFRRAGRTFLYTPLIKEQDYFLYILEKQIEIWAGGSSKKFIDLIKGSLEGEKND